MKNAITLEKVEELHDARCRRLDRIVGVANVELEVKLVVLVVRGGVFVVAIFAASAAVAWVVAFVAGIDVIFLVVVFDRVFPLCKRARAGG